MILLDTHVWFWFLNEPERLSATARDTIEETLPAETWIAAITLWEMAWLSSNGRLTLEVPVDVWLKRALEMGTSVYPLTPEVAVEGNRLPEPFHRDPADRMIVATARLLGARLVTKDRQILDYPHVATVW